MLCAFIGMNLRSPLTSHRFHETRTFTPDVGYTGYVNDVDNKYMLGFLFFSSQFDARVCRDRSNACLTVTRLESGTQAVMSTAVHSAGPTLLMVADTLTNRFRLMGVSLPVAGATGC